MNITPMRVLYLCHHHADTTVGGMAEFLHHLPKALKALNVEVILYTQAEKKRDAHLSGPVVLANGLLHYSGPFLKPQLFTSKKELAPLLALCQQEKIDLIHAQGTYRAGYMAMHVKKQSGIPYIITSHSDISSVNSKRIQRGNIKRRCQRILRNANYVTHLTPFMADHSHHIYMTQNKSAVITNGIDVSAWDMKGDYMPEDYLFTIGRLEPEKGFSILIDAYAELRKLGVKTSLVIAGTGSAEKALQSQAKQYGLNVITDFSGDNIPQESVIFTGYVRDLRKKSLFYRSRYILFPTQPSGWEEAFGIVQLEAMIAGKAMIASDIPAVRYLQKRGLKAQLVQPEEVNAWVKEIHYLLENEQLCQEMGKINYQAAQQFDWQRIAVEYKEIYESV